MVSSVLQTVTVRSSIIAIVFPKTFSFFFQVFPFTLIARSLVLAWSCNGTLTFDRMSGPRRMGRMALFPHLKVLRSSWGPLELSLFVGSLLEAFAFPVAWWFGLILPPSFLSLFVYGLAPGSSLDFHVQLSKAPSPRCWDRNQSSMSNMSNFDLPAITVF